MNEKFILKGIFRRQLYWTSRSELGILQQNKLIKTIQIELYVAEYTDKTGWEREWALLEESASQGRVNLPELLLSYEELK